MALHSGIMCVLVLLATTVCRPGMEAGAIAEGVRDVLTRAGEKLGAEFRASGDSLDAFAGTLTRGLDTCEAIDIEVRVLQGDVIEIAAYPRLRGGPLETASATDRPGLLKKLGASNERITPLSWPKEPEGVLAASWSGRWSDASAAKQMERALLAVRGLDVEVAELLSCFPPRLTEEEIAARLREAAANEARRGEILAGIAAYLPEVTPSKIPGRSTFRKIVMNGRGAGLDAFRFRVPAGEAQQRLVWAFAYPPGTAKGWYIAPVAGDAPRFIKFHSGKKYQRTGIPAEHATLLQRSETPLRGGGEYILWFQFKVERPVDIYVALGCFPFVKSDRDAPTVLEAALGLEEAH